MVDVKNQSQRLSSEASASVNASSPCFSHRNPSRRHSQGEEAAEVAHLPATEVHHTAVELEAELGEDQDSTWGIQLPLEAAVVALRRHTARQKGPDLSLEMDKLEPEGMRRSKAVLRMDMVLVLEDMTPMEVVAYSYTGTAERKAGDTKEVRMSAPGREVQTGEDMRGM